MNGCPLNIKNEIFHHFCRRPRNLPSILVQWAGGPSLRISCFPSSVFFWTPDTSRRTAAVWTRTNSVHGRETQKTLRDCLALEKNDKYRNPNISIFISLPARKVSVTQAGYSPPTLSKVISNSKWSNFPDFFGIFAENQEFFNLSSENSSFKLISHRFSTNIA